jgi:arginase
MAAEAQKIRLIRVPFAVGTSRPGNEQGADSFMEAGLGRTIRNLGRELTEEILSGEGNVKEISRLLAERVKQAVDEGAFPLVLGGDHSVTIGTWAGLTNRSANLGLLWFDAHPTLLTADTSTTGYANGMALATILGKSGLNVPGTERIRPDNIVFIGLRDVQPSEREWIRAEGFTCFTMHEIDRLGIEKVVESALRIAGQGTDGIHVSLDADVLDPLEAPGVDSAVPGGLFFREAHFAFELLAESGLITSMDVSEVNPFLDDKRRTSKLISGLIASLLGKKIL